MRGRERHGVTKRKRGIERETGERQRGERHREEGTRTEGRGKRQMRVKRLRNTGKERVLEDTRHKQGDRMLRETDREKKSRSQPTKTKTAASKVQ